MVPSRQRDPFVIKLIGNPRLVRVVAVKHVPLGLILIQSEFSLSNNHLLVGGWNEKLISYFLPIIYEEITYVYEAFVKLNALHLVNMRQ